MRRRRWLVVGLLTALTCGCGGPTYGAVFESYLTEYTPSTIAEFKKAPRGTLEGRVLLINAGMGPLGVKNVVHLAEDPDRREVLSPEEVGGEDVDVKDAVAARLMRQLARSPEEVGTVVLLHWRLKPVGSYVGEQIFGPAGYEWRVDATVINDKTRRVVDHERFPGGAPPGVIDPDEGETADRIGSEPWSEIFEWILLVRRLHRA